MSRWMRSGGGMHATTAHDALFERAHAVQAQLQRERREAFRSDPVPFVPKPSPQGWLDLEDEIAEEFGELQALDRREVKEAFIIFKKSEHDGPPGRRYAVYGQLMTIAQMAAAYRVDNHTIYLRIEHYGWDPERACSTPVRHLKPVVVDVCGEKLSLTELSKRHDVSRSLVRNRLSRGVSPERAVISNTLREGYFLHVGDEPIAVRDLASKTGLTTAAIYARLQSGKTVEQILTTPRRVTGEDLTGREYGRLTVLRESSRRTPANKRIYICRCSCGTSEKEIIGADLKSGRTVSCGCLFAEKASARARARLQDISGQNFANGGITVVRISDRKSKDKENLRLWECICNYCEQTFYTKASMLKLGQISSCGCQRKNRLSAIMRQRAKKVVVYGEKLTISELAEVSGKRPATIYERMRMRGMVAEEAAFKPLERKSISGPRPKRGKRNRCGACGKEGHNRRNRKACEATT